MITNMITRHTRSRVAQSARAIYDQLGAGHGWDHITRVNLLTVKFLQGMPDADQDFAYLLAVLHDVDDHKFFPEYDGRPFNASRILREYGVPDGIVRKTCSELSRIGYAKRLQGLEPETPEGRAVSDADMCDLLGANGILRLLEYARETGAAFFDPDDLPCLYGAPKGYRPGENPSSCRHMFEKVLKLPYLMLTEPGKAEAKIRASLTIKFLRELFREEDAEAWSGLLRTVTKQS